MRQLLLDYGVAWPQTLASFIIGRNQELNALLHQIAARERVPCDPYCVTIWGESGSGKTHLMRALAADPKALLLGPDSAPDTFILRPQTDLYLLEDAERFGAELQHAAFALYNEVREKGAFLIISSAQPPAQLSLREDLRTRLGWGLIYQLHGLSDTEKTDALSLAAERRGLSLSPGVLPYLLTHFRRDMQSLSAMLEALDHYSLETQRPITLPLLRELLQLGDANTHS